MLEAQRVFVVVPAYNEAARIREVLVTMPSFVDGIIVVDDASLDATAREAHAASAARLVEIITLPTNGGVGAAIVRGYREALALGADVVAVMAGDGQMDPNDLHAVVAPIVQARADYVKGNRLRHPEVWRSMPTERLLGSLVLSTLTAISIGQPLGDSQCGYTAIARPLLLRLDLSALWPRYGYPNDLLGAVRAAGGRILEVTVRPVYRGEQSGMRVWHAALIVLLIGRVTWRRVAVGHAASRATPHH
ncbi:MAG: glycosyltransferase family 2 protein [Myxococcales bacterium]|nr:glycosyltransferase family 2 protein [Myxococcales bacterium]